MNFLSRNKWFLLVCVVLVLLAHLFRYDIHSVYATSPAAYVLDRWSGQIELISEDLPSMTVRETEDGASTHANESETAPIRHRIRFRMIHTTAQ